MFIFYQPQEQVQEELPRLKEQIGEIQDRELGREIIDFIQTVLLYKFINLSQEEMEAMFSLSDLKKAGFIKRLGLRKLLRERFSQPFTPKSSPECCALLWLAVNFEIVGGKFMADLQGND